MSRCIHCQVRVKDETEHCPLCHTVLEKEGEGETTYPDVYTKNKRINFVFRLSLFLDIIIMVACIGVNIIWTPQLWWSVIVSAALIYSLWMLYIFSKADSGYRLRILSGVAGAVIFVILTDYVLGYRGWSIDYVLPAAIIVIDVTLLLLMLINRRNWQSYLILQLAMILVGLIPLIMVKVRMIYHPLLSEIAFGASVLLFLGTFILGGRTAANELKRRFHIK